MGATDTALCEFMTYNQWKQPSCTAMQKEPKDANYPACLYPRYCAQNSTWYHSPGWQNCAYRKH